VNSANRTGEPEIASEESSKRAGRATGSAAAMAGRTF
jgi:hypothetical protein